MSASAALLVVVGLLHPARRARAQLPLELEWVAPPECPQRTNVLERTQALVAGRSVATSHLRAAGKVEKLPKGYRLRLKIFYARQESERRFESATCSDLAGAAAVALALLVREEQAAARASSEPSAAFTPTVPSDVVASPPPTAASPSEAAASPSKTASSTSVTASSPPVPDVPAAPEPSAPPGPPWRVFLTGSVAEIDVGILPRPSVGFGVGVGVARGAYHLAASGTYGWSVTVPVERFRGLRAEFQRWTGDLTGCREWAWGRWGLAPCALVSLDAVWARGEGNYVLSRPEHSLWLDVGFRLVGMLQITPSVLGTITLGARLPTTYWTFSIDEVGNVHRVPMAAFDAALGVRWNL